MLERKKSSPIDARTYYQLGNEYYEKGDYEKAIENYNMAILLNPVFSEAYFNRALSYYQLKNFEKSISDYSKAAELDPKNPIIYNNRGDAYYRKQDFNAGIKDYDKAITLNPDYLKAFYNRGLSYASLEDYEKAVEDFTKVVALKPDFAEAYHLRGLAYEYSGVLEKAIGDYEKAIELNPDLEDAKSHLESAKSKSEQSGGGGGTGDSKTLDIKLLEKPTMTFEDVAGMEPMKDEIREAIVYPMMNPELARKYGKLGGGGLLMYGPPGCGKCVSKDTEVLLDTGEIKTIENIYYEQRENKEEIIEGKETVIENPEINVLSLNKETLKVEPKKVNYIYREKYKGKMYEITTRSGRKILVTPDHPFISIENGAKKIKASELNKGNYVAIPNKIDRTPIRVEINEIEGFRKLDDKLQFISWNKPHTKPINAVYELNPKIGKFFGYMLSEGAQCYGNMFFSNSDEELIDEVANTGKNIFGIEPIIKPDTSEGVKKVEISSVGLIKFLEKTHDFKLNGSRNAGVPKSIMNASNELVSEFLKAVFESEATVRKDVREIEFSTSSKRFANEISYLLLRFGIVARIKPKRIKNNNHTYWRLYICSGKNLRKFENEIGFATKRKQSALKKLTERDRDSTNTDVIPNISNLLKNEREKLGMDKTEFYRSKNGYRYELGKNLSRNYLEKILEGKEIEKLRRLVDADVLWDEVIEIKEKEIDDYIYDLTVNDNHTFIAGFGGIIVHNTYIIKAAAGECNAGFINAKLSDLLDMYVGNTEKNIHKVFELARNNTPAVLFFDEVDAIGGRRDKQEGQQYMRMAVNQMLYEIDGVEANNENVLVIAATNAPWDVDPALRRSGRFSKSIYIGEPDRVSREAILKLHSKKRPVAKGVPFFRFSLATSGYASADLKAVVEEAASYPWKEAFFAIEKKKTKYKAQGMSPEEAKEKATKEVVQRDVLTKDFVQALKKRKSTLPPWYEQAKKQIGKQEELTIVDGKEHKKVSDSKMGPGEKQMFRKLLVVIEKRNKLYNKIGMKILTNFAIYAPIPF